MLLLINFDDLFSKTIKSLEDVSLAKIDQASHSLLLNAINRVDPETLNFDVMNGDDKLFYCIWANLSHNPRWFKFFASVYFIWFSVNFKFALRIKDFFFAKKNLSFMLPRPLTLAHVAVRAVFMNFDMYSARSRTYFCRVKNEKHDFGNF